MNKYKDVDVNTPTGNTISRANKHSPQKFTQAYKLHILEKGARCKNITELHALLHHEKLHAAQLSKWWREFSSHISFERRFLKPIAEGSSVPVLSHTPQSLSGSSKQTNHIHKSQPFLIRNLLENLWRGRWAFSTTLIISMLLSGAYVRYVTPLFTAHALLEVKPQHSNVVFQNMNPSATDSYNVSKEIEVLRSYPIVEKVISLLNLDKSTLLNQEIKETGFLASLFPVFSPLSHVNQSQLSGIKVLQPAPSPESVALMEKVLDALEIDQIDYSRIIKISYTSKSPELAANIANGIAETYIDTQKQPDTSPAANKAETAAYINGNEVILLNPSKNQGIAEQHKILSYALPPTKATFPKVLPTLFYALIGSVLLGLLAIVIQALSRKGFRSAAEIEQQTGYPSLGMLPQLGRLEVLLNKPSDYVLKYPKAPFSEAVHSIYSNMLLAKRKTRIPPKIVQFTSAYPGEGRSTISRCLAITKRQSGIKTVIIDAGIRKPNLYKSLSLRQQPGLAEYLSGESAVHQIIGKHKKTGTYHITAGHSKKNPMDILASRRVDELFSDLKEVFDLIIIDSPPVLAVPDARLLASRVDMTTLVVKWGETRQEVVQYALQQLSGSGARQLTTLLTMVDARKHSFDTYADSGIYFGNLNRYFSMKSVKPV